MTELDNHLGRLRRTRGISAAQLAAAAGISRQTVYAIEAGGFMPNTAVSLRLARALETTVEELFTLPEAAAAPPPRSKRAALLSDGEPLHSGQPVQLCRVGRRLIASGPSPVPWLLPDSDAIVAGTPAQTKADVHIVHGEDFDKRILIAGCDPAISLLARHLHPAGIELVLAQRNSSQALRLLKEGSVHIAGTHLRDERSGESNLPEIARIFPRNAVALISFAVWEEGILTAFGNPKGIRTVEDFARKGIRIVNRDKGSGSRRLLDFQLQRLGLDGSSIEGYQRTAAGHLHAAWQIRTGEADCCIATRAAARVFGLGFLPLVSERYDLAIYRKHLNLPSIQALLDTLNRAAFRRELESAGGYDVTTSGQRML
jgi:putative molybdopterin biosynthesis protein